MLALAAAALATASPAVLDGGFDPAEWRGAATMQLGDGFALLVKGDGPNILLAIRFPQP